MQNPDIHIKRTKSVSLKYNKQNITISYLKENNHPCSEIDDDQIEIFTYSLFSPNLDKGEIVAYRTNHLNDEERALEALQ